MPKNRVQKGTIKAQVDGDQVTKVRVLNPGPLPIAEGDLVRVVDTAPGAIFQRVQPALATDTQTVLYVARHAIPVDDYGEAIQWKMVFGQDTSTATVGDMVYLSGASPGGIVLAAPAPAIVVGVVTRVGASDGSIMLKAPGLGTTVVAETTSIARGLAVDGDRATPGEILVGIGAAVMNDGTVVTVTGGGITHSPSFGGADEWRWLYLVPGPAIVSDTSASAPAGQPVYRRLLACKADGSGDLIPFRVVGSGDAVRTVKWMDSNQGGPREVFNDVHPAGSFITRVVTGAVPSTAQGYQVAFSWKQNAGTIRMRPPTGAGFSEANGTEVVTNLSGGTGDWGYSTHDFVGAEAFQSFSNDSSDTKLRITQYYEQVGAEAPY